MGKIKCFTGNGVFDMEISCVIDLYEINYSAVHCVNIFCEMAIK